MCEVYHKTAQKTIIRFNRCYLFICNIYDVFGRKQGTARNNTYNEKTAEKALLPSHYSHYHKLTEKTTQKTWL